MRSKHGLIALLVIAAVTITGCTAEDASKKALRASGMTDITLTGWSPISCLEDTFGTGFVATNPRGDRVEGTVCCGILKDCTVRY